MFQFLIGVAFGAVAYWAWQSFGRDLLGMGGDQGETSYGGFSSPSGGSTSFSSSPSSSDPSSLGSAPSSSAPSGDGGSSSSSSVSSKSAND
jgi:hypothetical protein